MLITLIRTAVFYVVTMIAVRIMGKRQIGQFEPSELVVTIMISELATMPIQDPDSPVINTLVAIFSLVSFEILISVVSLKSQVMRHSVSGQYSLLIDEGRINVEEMKKIQLTVDELMEELRQNGILNPSEVRYCILETSGKMSVFSKKKAEKHTFPTILISDGKVVKNNLKKFGFTKKELAKLVETKYDMKIKDFLMLLYEENKLTAVKKGGEFCDS